jgi:hypothetical protein
LEVESALRFYLGEVVMKGEKGVKLRQNFGKKLYIAYYFFGCWRKKLCCHIISSRVGKFLSKKDKVINICIGASREGAESAFKQLLKEHKLKADGLTT